MCQVRLQWIFVGVPGHLANSIFRLIGMAACFRVVASQHAQGGIQRPRHVLHHRIDQLAVIQDRRQILTDLVDDALFQQTPLRLIP